ncbi:hypothetical protein Tco_0471535 [Tanacetum coccineum]
MGRGTWYYSLGVFLAIVDAFVRSEFEISSWRGARVGVRTYLLGGAIDGSEANGIIRDPKLELESSRFTFDLVPLSYESVDVVVGENWLLRHKAEMVCHEKVVKMPCVPKELVGFTPRRRIGFRMELVQGATPICEGSCRLTSLERQEVWNDCRSCKVRVGSNGNLWWEASVLLGRKKGGMRNGHVEVYGYAFWVNQCTSGFHGVNEPGGVRVAREDDRGVTEGREDVREVFQQHGSGAKRKLSRCGRNQMGNEPILALPEGADDFVVYYDARSKDLVLLGKKRENLIACTSRTNLKVLMKDCMTNVRVVEGLTLERCSTFGKKDKLEPSYVGPFEILGWIGPIVRLTFEYGCLHLKHGMERESGYRFMGRNWRELWVVEGLTLERCSTFGKKDKYRTEFLKVRWDSKRGPELTWERKDQMRSKCPQLSVDSANASSS